MMVSVDRPDRSSSVTGVNCMVRPIGPHSVPSVISLRVLVLHSDAPVLPTCFRVCARSSVRAVSLYVCVCVRFFFSLFFVRFCLFFSPFYAPARSIRGGGCDEVPRAKTPRDRGGRVSHQHTTVVRNMRTDWSSYNFSSVYP